MTSYDPTEYDGYPPDRDDLPHFGAGLWVEILDIAGGLIATQPWTPGVPVTFTASEPMVIEGWRLIHRDGVVANGRFPSMRIPGPGDTVSLSIEASPTDSRIDGHWARLMEGYNR